jgi:hypothetical protein
MKLHKLVIPTTPTNLIYLMNTSQTIAQDAHPKNSKAGAEPRRIVLNEKGMSGSAVHPLIQTREIIKQHALRYQKTRVE